MAISVMAVVVVAPGLPLLHLRQRRGNAVERGLDVDVDHPVITAAQRPVICSMFSGYRAPCTVIFEAALSISRRSSDVSSTETAPMFSSKRRSFVVPGIGTIHGFWARSQASAI